MREMEALLKSKLKMCYRIDHERRKIYYDGIKYMKYALQENFVILNPKYYECYGYNDWIPVEK